MSDSGTRSGVLEQINSPLGFYVLALLIVEGALALVLGVGDLDPGNKWTGFLFMIGIFVVVVVIVTFLAIRFPKNLVFGKEEHAAPHTDPSALKDQIVDLVIETVKADCVKSSESPRTM